MSSSQDRMLNAKRGCALDDASMIIGVRQQHGRFEAAHVYITHYFYFGSTAHRMAFLREGDQREL